MVLVFNFLGFDVQVRDQLFLNHVLTGTFADEIISLTFFSFLHLVSFHLVFHPSSSKSDSDFASAPPFFWLRRYLYFLDDRHPAPSFVYGRLRTNATRHYRLMAFKQTVPQPCSVIWIWVWMGWLLVIGYDSLAFLTFRFVPTCSKSYGINNILTIQPFRFLPSYLIPDFALGSRNLPLARSLAYDRSFRLRWLLGTLNGVMAAR